MNAQHPFFNPTGFTAPAGYPRAERVAGGVRTPLPVATYASNKVIVGSVYAYPGDTTATPWGPGSLHATHVAGIMAGVEGTYNYTSGPATFPLKFSGMAPGAYIMSYRLDGDSAEFIAAIEDVVADQADALNISLGHSLWLTTDPVHDPVRKALDAAVDAGVVVVGSSGNAGANGDSSTTGSWKLSPKVITVANSSHARIFSNAVTVTGPGTVPASLHRPPGRARRRARAADRRRRSRARSSSLPAAPAATRARRARRSRRAAHGQDPARRPRHLHLRREEGQRHRRRRDRVASCTTTARTRRSRWAPSRLRPSRASWSRSRTAARSSPGRPRTRPPTVDIEGPLTRLTSGWPDVVAGSSSKGPGPGMEIKPDIAAPGSSVLSSVVNDKTGAVNPAGLFEQVSGTSMASPHITALAALTKAKHPTLTPAQVKSALMNTAHTTMSLDLEGNVPALAKHRGAGRVNAARLANPQLTFEPAERLVRAHASRPRRSG